ncbi:MAG TPA: AlpA family phage regulatory protein [Albitalea sp.]|nr:AlpA family phage regulatory protein [Albitalea sp.]
MNTSTTAHDKASRLLHIDEVRQRTGLGRTSTYALIARGQHPAPIKVGRRSMWLDCEIDGWIEQLALRRGL